MMKLKYALLLISLALTSCSVYRQKFDCPPDSGVPCTAVSDLEQMIVETPIGPDLFLGIDPDHSQFQNAPDSNRIWITNPAGGGYYMYLYREKKCCTH